MKTLNRPFKDKGATVGRAKPISTDITRSYLRFKAREDKSIRVYIPGRAPVTVKKDKAIQLAHWILKEIGD